MDRFKILAGILQQGESSCSSSWKLKPVPLLFFLIRGSFFPQTRDLF